MRDPYLYPDCETLKNLADIRDEQTLKNMEADYTLSRLSDVVVETSVRRFDFEGLCDLHYAIFQDVYEWAGKPRIINIEKSEAVLGELSIEYSDCFDIERDASRMLSEMNETDWKKEPFDSLVKKFSDCLAGLWKVHPYREGNTRTVITFCCLFIEAQGIYIESNLFKDNATYMRDALVAANAIFSDIGDLRKPEYLYRIVEDALEQGKEMKKSVCKQLEEAGFSITETRIREVVLWNRRTHREHSTEELKTYLEDKKTKTL